MVSRRQRKREKVAVGQGLRECKAGYETKKCGELRVRWRELRALGERGQNTSVCKSGFWNITWPIKDIEKDREPEIKII